MGMPLLKDMQNAFFSSRKQDNGATSKAPQQMVDFCIPTAVQRFLHSLSSLAQAMYQF